VAYRDADALMHGLAATGVDDHLLLLEHPHTYTLGVRADPAHVLVDAASVGAELITSDRGGDVTYHGPGQLVGYPVLWLPGKGGGDRPDTVAYVSAVEQLVIDALADVGLAGAARLCGFPGVWVDADGPRPRKIAAIGVRINRGRS
jgi:lipoic acid synthetase